MFFLNAVETLEESEVFKKWKKKNPNSFLTIGFIVCEDKAAMPWSIGYYNPDTEKISSFIVDSGLLEFDKTDDVYHKPEDEILGLDISEVKIDIQELMDDIDKVKEQKYKSAVIIKYMFIIQNIKNFGTVWNVTLFSQTLNAINLKFDAKSGKLVDESLGSLISNISK